MKNVLVTAPFSPLGKYFIEYFGERNYFLFLHYRKEHHKADNILRKYRGEGFNFKFTLNNLDEWIREISFIKPDILVNNFGPFIYKNWEKQSYNEWRKIFEFNLFITFFSTKEALTYMKKKSYGRIINIGFHNLNKTNLYFPNVLPYAISKFGVKAVTDTLSKQISKKHSNIKINMISPEYIEGSKKPTKNTKPLDKNELFEVLDLIILKDSPSGKNFYL